METDRDTDSSSELRPIACEQNFLSKPDGSATFTQGKLKSFIDYL